MLPGLGDASFTWDEIKSDLFTVAMTGASMLGSAKDFGTSYCFVAGTLITTAGGFKPIEEIEVGDEVLSQNERTGEIAYKKVYATSVSETNEFFHIHVNGEEIVATGTHPFYVHKFGWTTARALRAGDVLVLSNGELVTVEWIEHEILEEPLFVYNFEVEDFHTYFVGSCGILVHNGDTCTSVDLSQGEKKYGGSFKDVNATRGTDEVAHHMPQNKYDESIGIKRDDGPALLMKKEDHKMTRTFAGKGKATMRIDAGLTSRQRLAQDIMDIKKNFGKKYNKGIRELLDYAKTLPEFQKG
ncbi:MAG: hypothetical protein IJ806_03935 [Ruminococcus sp.]|nr:hypothetical protein [Ruminococcus sp.]